jgi:hypothetical protein
MRNDGYKNKVRWRYDKPPASDMKKEITRWNGRIAYVVERTMKDWRM